jgi:hypothetical protein
MSPKVCKFLHKWLIMWPFKKKPVEPICKNCRLFDSVNLQCGVVILHEGKKLNLPVEPNDKCFFESEYIGINPDNGTQQNFKIEVEQVRAWVEHPKSGEKTESGVVKIEFPESLEPIYDVLKNQSPPETR